jgi:hypothetical protein
MESRNPLLDTGPGRAESDSAATKSLSPALVAFMAANPSRTRVREGRSVLDDYWAEISTLRGQKYSLEQIQQFLKTVGVTVSRSGIHNFINKKLKP